MVGFIRYLVGSDGARREMAGRQFLRPVTYRPGEKLQIKHGIIRTSADLETACRGQPAQGDVIGVIHAEDGISLSGIPRKPADGRSLPDTFQDNVIVVFLDIVTNNEEVVKIRVRGYRVFGK